MSTYKSVRTEMEDKKVQHVAKDEALKRLSNTLEMLKEKIIVSWKINNAGNDSGTCD